MSDCAFGDESCPCQDGDLCHYVDDPASGTVAMSPPHPSSKASASTASREIPVRTSHSVIVGVDPGATTGVYVLRLCDREILGSFGTQIHGPEGVVPFVEAALFRNPSARRLIAVEAFVVGNRAGRSRGSRGGETARDLIGALQGTAAPVVRRTASMVKTWSTDVRLDAAGFLEGTRGMPHARDAARHALYAAVSARLLHDPLSARAGA